MRFLHAADIHLDSPLAGMTRRDPELARLTATCTREAFANAIDLAHAHDVAFMLIAGDLYDGEHRNFETGLFFAAQMRRLGRPCVMIHGNHDSASQVTKSLQPPPNVTILPSRSPGQVTLADWNVVVHGQSFAGRAERDDLAASYRDAVPGAFNIGLLHSSVEDGGDHATYAPCRIETLANKNYDYWALGHVHTRATLHDAPHIHFPGNTQGRHVKETGSRGVTIVEVEDGRVRSLAHHPTDVLRWGLLTVDVSQAATMGDLAGLLRFELAAARLDADGRPLIVRVVLRGATPLHAALLADPGGIDAECQAAAAAIAHDLHIERVKLRTRPVEDGAGDLAPLEQSIRAALAEPALVAALLQDFARLGKAIPAGAQAEVPRTEEAVAALGDDAWEVIRHALLGKPADAAA